MRRLTLILSDLYLPEEAASDIADHTSAAMADLEELLRFARVVRIDDWRTWLARDLGVPEPGRIAPAVAERLGVEPRGAWLATPVRLEARLDHVRMLGLERIAPDEAIAGCAEFARHFGPALALHVLNERALLLTGVDAVAETVDPARLIGADVADSLPRGATALRRLGAEIEMWLHASALNEARERNRAPRVSTLWLWGGGDARSSAVPANVELRGGDPFLAALAPRAVAAPPGFDALTVEAEHGIVELAPISGGAHERLMSLDAGWFAPLRAALASRALDDVRIVANDRCFVIHRQSRWKFWRRRRPWLELLGATAARA
jgi:hypothetical protein